MFKIDGNNNIHCTRGDIGTIHLKIKQGTGYYQFQPGDIVIFTVKKNLKKAEYNIRKIITPAPGTDIVEIPLTKADTTIGNLISRRQTYYYDIALGDDQTVIGFDNTTGAKYFYLYPEASNDE